MDEITFNIILIGDSDVGKTSLMIRFADNIYEENCSTLGMEFRNRQIEINDQKIKLHILDTAGQEKYRSVAKNFIRKGDGIIFVFDLNNEQSFESIKSWLITCDEVSQDYQKILVGNNFNPGYRKVSKEIA